MNQSGKWGLATIALVLLFAVDAFGAETNPVGIVLKAPSDACRLVRAESELAVTKGMKLFPGDVFKKPAAEAAPEVKWWPYASWGKTESEDKLVVAFAPPGSKDKKGMVDQLKSYMGFVDTEFETVHGVSDMPSETRREQPGEVKDSFDEQASDHSLDAAGPSKGAESSPPAASPGSVPQPAASELEAGPGAGDMAKPSAVQSLSGKEKAGGQKKKRSEYPQPGYKASLMGKVAIRFACDPAQGVPTSIVFTDEAGKEVFKRPATGSVNLKAEEIGIEPGKVYRWRFEGVSGEKDKEVRLIDPETMKTVREDFNRIASETADPVQKKLQQAAYLQFVSDLGGTGTDLYWLSFKLLTELLRDNPGHPAAERYREKCLAHLDQSKGGK